jgi:CCR4-NOT transcription complex subunit 2
MGLDLTTFGLNLNSADSLYLSFTSPFADVANEPVYNIPQCYNTHPPALKPEHLSKFHLETLFYMFYQLPRDILQACAAQELYRRDWRYHAELKIWLKPRTPTELAQSHPTIQFVYFDAKAWEVRLFNAAQVRGNLKAGLVSEEDIRVKPQLPGLAPIGEPS